MLKKLFHKPVIVILGSTATGKSKLGIELTKKFNGEIISVDSMQVYKGLDIITNKVTATEAGQVKHHMIDIVSPPNEYNVVEFRNKALGIIDQLFEEKKIPVIVGGTNYYIESLLWNFLIDDDDDDDDTSEKDINTILQQRKLLHIGKRKRKLSVANKDDTDALPDHLLVDNDVDCSTDDGIGETESGDNLYKRLQEVDPERAAQLHPNNIRKISRSLQIYLRSGRKHSDLLLKQKQQAGSSGLSGPLRFTKSLVFWLTCEQEVLDKRISERVDSMIQRGIKEEISKFYEQYKQSKYQRTSQTENVEEIKTKTNDHKGCNTKMDHTKLFEEGLFQAIGFKEFHSYFTYEGNDDVKADKLLKECLELHKRATIKYSKKQKTWVRNRFLSRPIESAPNIYKLDATNLNDWHEHVFVKAFDIASAFLKDENGSHAAEERIIIKGSDPHRKYVCNVCNDRVIMGDLSWQKHLASRVHKKLKCKLNREQNIKDI